MTKGQRNSLKLALTAACFAWVGVAGWLTFTNLPQGEIRHHGSEEVKERMRECEGTFKQRYDCKEAIVIESGRDTFWNMIVRLALITGPAIVAGGVGSALIRRIPLDKPPPPPEDTDWKTRAQAHIRHSGAPTDQSSGQS